MQRAIILAAICGTVVALSGCVSEDETRTQVREASGAAESACMSAVNSNYGGNVGELRVVRSEFSQANSEVILDAVGVRGGPQTERWRCLSSNDGQVADLSVMQ